jgi:hypothetical protein
MKPLFKKIIYIAAIFLIIGLISLAYTYTAGNLKSFVVKTLENSFGAKLSIAHMRISFPLCLELKGVKINDTVTVSKVYIYPSPEVIFLKKPFIVSKVRIVEPVVRLKDGGYNFSGFTTLTNGAQGPSHRGSKALFYVSRIEIEKGSLIYGSESAERIEVVNINGQLKGPYVYFASTKPFNFEVSGFIKDNFSGILSPLRLEGLISGVSGMPVIKAKLQANDVALGSLGKIYQNYLEDKVTGGSLNLDTKILISEGDLKADCFCRINDVILNGAAGKLSMPLLASFILGFDFKDKSIKIDNLQTNLFSLLFTKS